MHCEIRKCFRLSFILMFSSWALQHSVEPWHDNFHTINTVFIHVIECQNKVLTNGDISNLHREGIPVSKYEGS